MSFLDLEGLQDVYMDSSEEEAQAVSKASASCMKYGLYLPLASCLDSFSGHYTLASDRYLRINRCQVNSLEEMHHSRGRVGYPGYSYFKEMSLVKYKPANKLITT